MPYKSKETKMEKSKSYYEANKEILKEKRKAKKSQLSIVENEETKEGREREQVIIQYYKFRNNHYDYVIWIRNIKRVHKELLSNKDVSANTFVIGNRYISLKPNEVNDIGTPIFFTIKSIDENILNIERFSVTDNFFSLGKIGYYLF